MAEGSKVREVLTQCTLLGDFSVSKKGERLISGLRISTSILCLSMAVEVEGWHISKKMIPRLYVSTFWEWMQKTRRGDERDGEERGEMRGRNRRRREGREDERDGEEGGEMRGRDGRRREGR